MIKNRFPKILLTLLVLIIIFPVTVQAKTKTPYICPQYDVAKGRTNVWSSYALFHNSLVIYADDLLPNQTYKLYKKEAKKKWKIVDTFYCKATLVENKYTFHTYTDNTGIMYNYDDTYGFVDDNIKPNTCYYYKLYSCDTKQFSGTKVYWSPVKNPWKNFRQIGNKVTWKKSKNVAGYYILYHKHYSFLDGYFQDDVYNLQKVSAKKNTYTIPNGYKADSVYAYTKHFGKYYLDYVGMFRSEGAMRKYIKDLLLEAILQDPKWVFDARKDG